MSSTLSHAEAGKKEFRDRQISSSYLNIEDIASLPFPGTAIPGNIKFSPDSHWISYLYSEKSTLERQLYLLNMETRVIKSIETPIQPAKSDSNIPLEEALRRERQRIHEIGVTHYSWATQAQRILIPLSGDLYLLDADDLSPRKILTNQGNPIQDAQISPDGNWIAYVQDSEIFLIPAEGGDPRQLTHGARETGKTNGLAEFIAQEEMDREHGFWWSDNSQQVAFIEVDETHIPTYTIIHQGKDFTGEIAQEHHRYPFAGKENARVRLGVISIFNEGMNWSDLGENTDIYLARVHWMPNGSLMVEIENREQTRLDLVRYDLESKKKATVLTESNPIWINLHNLFRPIKGKFNVPEGFIWASERTGFRHLYFYDSEGNLVRQLTSGEWMVDDIVGVDEKNQLIYFTATSNGPIESHLHAVTFNGDLQRQLTKERGVHTIICDNKYERFVDIHHNCSTPPHINLSCLKTGELDFPLYENNDSRIPTLKLQAPTIRTIYNRSGDVLYGALFRPPENYGQGPFPTIVCVYGGPNAQLVVDSWQLTVNMRAQYLSSLGFLVFILDNRGSARRGMKFESTIKNRMGSVEVEDQVDGVRWLIDNGLADPERIGIYGWSYGGYMAALCLAKAPEIFKVAVAGAPVTHCDGYDTHYTERYLGTPINNPDGYQNGSVLAHVKNITGKLMLVHGLIDENVHFRHTARLINALIHERKQYDLLLFPDERHMPRRKEDRIYMEEAIRDYFINNL